VQEAFNPYENGGQLSPLTPVVHLHLLNPTVESTRRFGYNARPVYPATAD
jgi:hypothetical protein